MKQIYDNLDWQKSDGLIPAIIQHAETSQVLMLGYMNEEALEKTLADRQVTFYSRSKQRLWTKGETSGNFLELVDVQTDCDSDALLIQVLPQGATCHTGTQSCFNDSKKFSVSDLYTLVSTRKAEMPEGSYTTDLLKEGTNKICTKIAEESGEVIKAATKEGPERLKEESVDLIYHLFVLLASQDVSYQEILNEIEKRNKDIKT